MTFALHVVDNVRARRSVQVALRDLDPRAQIATLLDGLDVGPLADIDDRAVLRRRFWKTIGFSHDHWLHLRRADARLYKLLRDRPREIILWRGLNSRELLIGHRFAARFARLGCPVFEVVNEERPEGASEFYSMIGGRSPQALAALWPGRTLIQDLGERAARWEALKRGGSFFRPLKYRTEIGELGEDAHDEFILTGAALGWKPIFDVIYPAIFEAMAGERVIAWRIQILIARGRLEGRGKGRYGPAEIRFRAR